MRRLIVVLLASLVAAGNMRLLLADVKQSGASRTSGSGGLAAGDTIVWTGSNTFTDSLFFVVDNGDATKKLQVEVSGITTGNTIVPMTFGGTTAAPTIAFLTGGTYTFNGPATFNGTNTAITLGLSRYLCWNLGSGYPCFYAAAQDTPDMMKFAVDGISRGFTVVENGDEVTAFNHPLATHPWFYWQSSNQAVITEYSGVGAVGTRSELFKTLTESSATAIVQIPVAASDASSGILEYAIFAKDGTDQQLRESSIRYAVTNKAGTETCTITTMAGVAVTNETNDGNAASISAGTLTYAIACDTAPTNAVNITFNAVSSLTQTTLQARYQARHRGASEPLPQ